MSFSNKLYLIALAIFATAFLSMNPYAFEFIALAIILLLMGISIKKGILARIIASYLDQHQ